MYLLSPTLIQAVHQPGEALALGRVAEAVGGGEQVPAADD